MLRNIWNSLLLVIICHHVVMVASVKCKDSTGTDMSLYRHGIDNRGIVLLNCAGAMNRKGLAQDGLALQLVGPIFAVVEYLLQKRKIANFLFNR